MSRIRLLKNESGQVVPIVALCVIMLIGFMGLAVDVGYLRLEKRHLQAAADAAALAAALEVRVCGTTPNCSVMQTAAKQALVENGYSGATLQANCAPTTGASLTLTINNGPCISSSDPNRLKSNYVEAVVSETKSGYFSRILHFSGFPMRARAEAAHGLGGPCIYALNPTASGALTIALGIGFKSNCTVVVESSSSQSINCAISLGVTAPELQVSPTGGGTGLLCLGNTHSTQRPLPTPKDPLAYLPAPLNTACVGPTQPNTATDYYGSNQQVNILLSLLTTIRFHPGVYCGGIAITVSALSNITFLPGTYVLNNGPGILLSIPGVLALPSGLTTSGLVITLGGVLANISGTGVTFYNAGNKGGFSLTGAALGPIVGGVNFSAPTSGEYGGILFYQPSFGSPGDQTKNPTGTFLVNALTGQGINGVVYEPGARVVYGVAILSTAGAYNGIVADNIQFTLPILSTINNDYSTLLAGSPFNGDRSFLVQ
jgi:hypothetical protein